MTNEVVDQIPRPVIDYANLPYLPREGVQSPGNYKYATKSLFLETAEGKNKPDALWTLQEHEVFAFGRWFPSAWMCYIYATDEYDALRKICGNVKGWEYVKNMKSPKDFSKILPYWQMEQAYLQKSALRETLYKGALTGDAGYVSAAKTLLTMIDASAKMPVGRPKKEVEEVKDPGVEADAKRVLQFQS